MAPTWGDYAADLRTLADTIDILRNGLPLPRFPQQGLTIEVNLSSALDVLAASNSLGVDIEEVAGHTRTQADIDTLHLRFVHVGAEAKAEYAARTSYDANIAVTS